MEFRKLSDGTVIKDTIQYIKDYLVKWENTHYVEVIVGSDSQNKKRFTQYGTVIVLHNTSYDSGIGKGAHVLYKTEYEDRPHTRDDGERRDHRYQRLLKEAKKSIVIAEELRKNGIHVHAIDLDLNPSIKFKSNEVLAEAIGWTNGIHGFNVRHKPVAFCSSYAADKVCH